jgi:hypothetical protein
MGEFVVRKADVGILGCVCNSNSIIHVGNNRVVVHRAVRRVAKPDQIIPVKNTNGRGKGPIDFQAIILDRYFLAIVDANPAPGEFRSKYRDVGNINVPGVFRGNATPVRTAGDGAILDTQVITRQFPDIDAITPIDHFYLEVLDDKGVRGVAASRLIWKR